jgi:hypothetical protein
LFVSILFYLLVHSDSFHDKGASESNLGRRIKTEHWGFYLFTANFAGELLCFPGMRCHVSGKFEDVSKEDGALVLRKGIPRTRRSSSCVGYIEGKIKFARN